MFRLDEERVVDATLCGGLARYINHSCNPNCVAEIVEVERDLRIIIFAKRRISRGEEVIIRFFKTSLKNLYCSILVVLFFSSQDYLHKNLLFSYLFIINLIYYSFLPVGI